MSNAPETLAAIVRELREDAQHVEAEIHDDDFWSNDEAAAIYRDLADRIEAAAERQNHCKKRFDEDGNEMPPHCAFQSLRLDHALAENDALRAALVEISQMCGVGPNEVSAIQIAYICDKALRTKGE